MRLSLEALEVLDAIDRKGSFASAAAELHRVPSAVTYSVKQLEDTLGVALFDRRGHRAVMTAAGRALLDEGRRLLRAAADLECRVQQVARGWETELRIAVDAVIETGRFLAVVGDFYRENGGTRLRVLHEVLGGTWDALESGRADLAVGASGEPPSGRALALQPMGRLDMVLVAAPSHPLCTVPGPIPEPMLREHRAVSVADTSRLLSPRTVGLASGQDTLTVASMRDKADAHAAGLGVGFLPRPMAEREAAAGRLRILATTAPRPPAELFVAWRPGQEGRALKWFARRLHDAATLGELLS